MAAPSAEPPCGLCGAAAAPYTCPRCNRRLCSLRCYRGHGGCAEAFYRQQVLQALEAEPGPPGLDAAFRRLRQLREAEDSAGPVGRDLWESLSPAERADFQRLLSSGEAAELLPPWRPWWWRRRGEEEEEGEEDAAAPPPPLPAAVPSLSSFPAPPPSPLLPFQLPNVLYGYAFALALHRGDETLLPELPAAAVDVSAALRGRSPFPDAAAAIEAARRDAREAGYPPCPLGDAGTVLAVAELLEGTVAGGDTAVAGGDAAVALAHLAELLRRGERVLPRRERGPFGRARRKCWFLLAWSRQQPAQRLAGLASAVRSVSGSMELVSGALDEGLVSGAVNEGLRGRRLIEELD